jgi:putative membrane protein
MKKVLKKKLTKNFEYLVLAILYIVGLLAAFTPYFRLSLGLTPLILIITAALLVRTYQSFKTSNLYVFLVVALFGYSIEYLGIETQALFGPYTYGETLGLKYAGVPLVMSLNWLILSYSSYQLARKINSIASYQVPITAVLMLLVDLPLEFVAPKLGFWRFDYNYVPLQNYIVWFIAAFGIAMFYQIYLPKAGKIHTFAIFCYATQLSFFVLLNFIL